MNTRYGILVLFLMLSLPGFLTAQSYRSRVNDANDAYNQQKYDLARDGYSKASNSDPERIESWFNNGNAAYRGDDIQAALRQYEQAGKRARSKEELAGTLYNAGDVFLNAAEKGGENPALKQTAGDDPAKLKMEGYRQAIDLYKKSLKLNPSDADTRYNLTYAKKRLEELKQQQQNQDKDQKQDKKDKNEDEKKQDKSKQDEQQEKDEQQKKEQQEKQEQQQKDQQKPDQDKPKEQKKQPQMSKQQAEQILRALERQEKDLQKQKRQEVPVRISVEKDW